MTSKSNSQRPPAVVLVVEDEPIQRLEMIALVEEAGFTAVEAWDADHAVSILEARLDIHLVFTDIEMPGSMDGLKLAAAIRHRWPPIEIIVTSAGTRPDIASLPARSMFLPKPINPDAAIRAMQQFVA
jgi:CheY-like chemotaxis protein